MQQHLLLRAALQGRLIAPQGEVKRGQTASDGANSQAVRVEQQFPAPTNDAAPAPKAPKSNTAATAPSPQIYLGNSSAQGWRWHYSSGYFSPEGHDCSDSYPAKNASKAALAPAQRYGCAAVLLAQTFCNSTALRAHLTTQCGSCTISLRPRRLLPEKCLLAQNARVHLRTGSRACITKHA